MNLISRLRGEYEVGPNGELGTRDFSAFIPPISIEAANRMEKLERTLQAVTDELERSNHPVTDHKTKDAIELGRNVLKFQ